jgi:hypothetical protein
MSTVASAQAPSSGAPRVETPAADHRDGRRHRLRPGRLIALALVVAAVAAGMPSAIRWVDDRRTCYGTSTAQLRHPTNRLGERPYLLHLTRNA